MENVFTIGLFIVGLALIIKCGDWFVDAAGWIAKVSGIPDFIVGATVVSLGTTLPELIVSIIATIDGKNDIAAGNAIGSVTANSGLIMAIAIICMPSVIKRRTFSPKALLMVCAAVTLLIAYSLSNSLSMMPTLILLAIFGVFIAENVISAKSQAQVVISGENKVERPTGKEIAKNVVMFIVGAAGIAVGAQLLVDKGSIIATDILGVPESIVGVTLIAVGTSLPELVTMITAVSKKQASMSVGNIIGANVIDLTLILPVCSLISGGTLAVAEQTVAYDLPFCLGIIAICVFPTILFRRFYRFQGIVALATYMVYLVMVCMVQLA